jgi:membrane protein required for colicin V production
MNALDIVILSIAAFCMVRGLFRGVVKETTSIVGVLAGFYTACAYYSVLARWLSRFIVNESYLNIISFLIAFFIVYLAIGFVGVILKHLLKAAKLRWAERVLGGTIGVVKAFLIVAGLLVALTTFLPKNSALLKNSHLSPCVTIASEKMVVVIPKAMKEKFQNNIKALKQSWKES